jgi:hypothetical protein
VGAAIATASQGVANAETDAAASPGPSSSSVSGAKSSDTVDAGPKDAPKGDSKGDTKTNDPDADAPETDTDLESAPHTKTTTASLTKKLRQTAEAFEAEQVEKLRAVFTPKPVTPAAPQKSTRGDTGAQSAAEPAPAPAAAETETADAEGPAAITASPSGVLPPGVEPTTPSVDPFRPDDPTPFAVPALFRNIELSLLNSPFVSREYAPYVREGLEFAYRASQVVPVVDTVVPVTEIVPQILAALISGHGSRDTTQAVVNQLLLTTQPAALLFYGYDQVADILNMEFRAQELKEDFYATAWNILDPLHLLHIAGHSGLERYPGGVGSALGSG